MTINVTQFDRRSITGTAAVTAGTTQTLAGATPITAAITSVTTGNANDGVALPTGCVFGDEVVLFNLSAVALKVWPPAAGQVNGATAGAAHVHAASKPGTYMSIGNESWMTILGA